MKILFLLPYPLKQAPSQRFRVEQYLEVLAGAGFDWDIQTFLTTSEGASIFEGHGAIHKILAVISGMLRRFQMLFRLSKYEWIFIHREAAPIGPPVFEWIASRLLKKKIIYDFDDAIWMTDNAGESWIKRTMKWRSKVASICRWSYRISCGNDWLAAYASQFNASVVVNPTTIDTVGMHRRELYPQVTTTGITIGWTGSYTTLKYLQPLQPVIAHLEIKYPGLIFLVIADKPPVMNLKSLRFVPWSMQSEVRDLLGVDIGVMPLPEDAWSKGKCGFKALQYMALEIPTLLSPVGVNTRIVSEGENGFFCADATEWTAKLEQLINDAVLRKKIGLNGRATVEKYYSVVSNTSNFLFLFA